MFKTKHEAAGQNRYGCLSIAVEVRSKFMYYSDNY